MIASTFLITAVGSFISLKIVEPSLGEYEGRPEGLDDEDEHRMDPLSAEEKRGLWHTLWATLLFAGLIVILVVPEGAILRNQETGAVAGSPFAPYCATRKRAPLRGRRSCEASLRSSSSTS
jgi:aminobenzoyl-glutamate transport protein